MEHVQRGLLAAGALLFLLGVTITLGPATGVLGGADGAGVDPGDGTPTPGAATRERATETPTSGPGGPTNDGADGPATDSGPTDAEATDDGSLVDAEVDVGDESGGSDGEETADHGHGDDRSDRGNGKKRGHDDEPRDRLTAPVVDLLG